MSKMTIVDLPGDRWMVVLSEMPHLDASDESPEERERVADFRRGRQILMDAGAAAVLRFGFPMEVDYVQLRQDVDTPSDH